MSHPTPPDTPLAALLDKLQALGIRLAADGQGGLRVRAAKGLLDQQLTAELQAHKPALLAWLQSNGSIDVPPSDALLPLTPQQLRIWFACQPQDNPAYHMPLALLLAQLPDVEQLNRVLAQLLQRHPILGARLVEKNGRVWQQRQPDRALAITPQPSPLSGADKTALAAECQRLLEQGMDLASGPLLAIHLLALADGQALLLLNIHHLASDGWSNRLLLADLQALLHGDTLADSPADYFAYASQLEKQINDGAFETALQFWQQQLAAVEPLALAGWSPPPASGSSAGLCPVPLTADSASLKAAAAARQCSLFALLFSAQALMLHKLTGRQHFALAMPVANRLEPRWQACVGLFANTVAVPVAVHTQQYSDDFISACHHSIQASQLHGDTPLALVAERLGLAGQQALQALFQCGINHLVVDDTAAAAALADGETLPLAAAPARFPLMLLIEQGEQLALQLEYDPAVFARPFIDQLAVFYRRALDFLLQPGQPLQQFRLLSEAEQLRLMGIDDSRPVAQSVIEAVFAASQTHQALDSRLSLYQLFARQLQQQPLATAVSDDQRCLSWQALDEQSARLAAALQQHTRSGDMIAVCLNRSVNLSVALLAINRSGNSWLLLEPELPLARRQQLLDDSGASLLLSEATLADGLACRQLVDINADRHWPPAGNAPIPAATDLLCLIYTSGSTGTPKGVRVMQHGIVNRLLWMQQQYPIGAGDVVLQKTAQSFDVSLWELFWPLLSGARLHYLAPGAHRDVDVLCRTVRQQQVSVIHFVPSMLAVASEHPDFAGCDSLRLLFCSGEALPAPLAQRVIAQLPHCGLHNLYGPTEASIDVSYFDCREAYNGNHVPIGKPLANTWLHIVDAQLQPLPPGIAGEIVIGGVQLADGYHRQPALSAAAFVDNPWYLQGHACARLYKTGDLGRYRADGNIEYIGRRDLQLKLHGQRIEPGEIEAQLLALPGIHQALVLLANNGSHQQLVAFYAARQPHDAAELRRLLAEKLPAGMLPGRFVWQRQLPLGSSGKVDRAALQQLLQQGSTATPATPATMDETERAIWPLWQALLPATASVDDNFFALGGHSLLAARLLAQLASHFAVDLRFADLLEHASIAALAQLVRQRQAQAMVLPPLPADDNGPQPASLQQQRLYLFQQLLPQSPAYHMPAAFAIHGPLQIAALEKAWQWLVRRHHVLHSVYRQDGDQLYQQRLADYRWVMLYQDVSKQPPDADTLLKQLAASPFRLDSELPLRVALYKTGPQHYLLCACLHHIAGDAASLAIIAGELAVAYRAFAAGNTPALPAAVQYSQYARWQQGQCKRQAIDYWRDELADAPALLTLPHDRPRPALQQFDGRQQQLQLTGERLDKLQRFCRQQQLTPFVVLLSCYQLLLGKLARQQDVSVALAVSGRHHPQLQNTVGFLVNSLIIRSRQHHNSPFADFLQAQQHTLHNAYRFQDVALESLLEQLGYRRQPGYTPVAQVGFNYLAEDLQAATADWGGLAITPLQLPLPIVKNDMTWIAWQHKHGIQLTVEYNHWLFDDSTISHWLDAFCYLLDQALANPGQPIHQLPCVPPQRIADSLQLAAGEQYYPLTTMQRDIYIDSLINPGERHNYLGFVTHTRSPVDEQLWQQAVADLYRHNRTLRSVIRAGDEATLDSHWQVVSPADRPLPAGCFVFHDLGDTSYNDDIKRQLVDNVLYQPYTENQPLWRMALYRFAGQQHLLVLAAHHALFDGVSIQLLGRMIKDNYQALLAGKHDALQYPADNFADFVDWHRQHSDRPASLAYWQQQAAQLQAPASLAAVLADRPGRFCSCEQALDEAQWQAIRNYCRSQRSTAPLFFKTLFALAIKAHFQLDGDFVFSEVTTGRSTAFFTTLGLCFDQQPNCLPASVSGAEQCFADVMHHLKQQRKTLAEFTPLSLAAQRRLFPPGPALLFNFYIMESTTPFLGRDEPIEHCMPPMAQAINLVCKLIDERPVLYLSWNDRQLDGEVFFRRLLAILQRLLAGPQPLASLLASDADSQRLALSLEQARPGDWVTAQPDENGEFTLQDNYGQPAGSRQLARLMRQQHGQWQATPWQAWYDDGK
ncbi:MAG TPA: amino acid adenylation domain-containing protein, partial [Pseudomonadales bacterium]